MIVWQKMGRQIYTYSYPVDLKYMRTDNISGHYMISEDRRSALKITSHKDNVKDYMFAIPCCWVTLTSLTDGGTPVCVPWYPGLCTMVPRTGLCTMVPRSVYHATPVCVPRYPGLCTTVPRSVYHGTRCTGLLVCAGLCTGTQNQVHQVKGTSAAGIGTHHYYSDTYVF